MSQLSNTGALFNSTGLLPKSMMLNMVLHNFPRNWPLCVCGGDVVSLQDLRPASKKEPRWTTRPTDPRFETNRPKLFNCHFFGLLVFFFPDQICRCGETRTHAKLFRSNFFGPKHSLFRFSSFVLTFGVEAWPRPRWPTDCQARVRWSQVWIPARSLV